MYWTYLTWNSEFSSRLSILHTSLAKSSSKFWLLKVVKSISPLGRYVFRGTDPNDKTCTEEHIKNGVAFPIVYVTATSIYKDQQEVHRFPHRLPYFWQQ